MRWLVLIVLACVAAGPATKPAKPDFADPKLIVMSIPKKEFPEPSRPWDGIASDRVYAWLKSNAIGKTSRISFRLGEISTEQGKPRASAGWAMIHREGREFEMDVRVEFVKEAADWLEQQKNGTVLTVQGKIDDIKLQGGPRIFLNVTITDVDPRPAKKR